MNDNKYLMQWKDRAGYINRVYVSSKQIRKLLDGKFWSWKWVENNCLCFGKNPYLMSADIKISLFAVK